MVQSEWYDILIYSKFLSISNILFAITLTKQIKGILFSILVFPKLRAWAQTHCQFKPQAKAREPTQVYCKNCFCNFTARIITIYWCGL